MQVRSIVMAVPRMSQLRQGVKVNVVLKADQRSGRLTTGHVSDILTKGDHPRGIKVRLTDGQIGRVQSLASNTLSSQSNGSQPATPVDSSQNSFTISNNFRFQDDYRNDPTPEESRSLEDYIKVKPAKKRGKKDTHGELDVAPQTLMESEFPNLDTALIAAILADHQRIEDTREVLSSIAQSSPNHNAV